MFHCAAAPQPTLTTAPPPPFCSTLTVIVIITRRLFVRKIASHHVSIAAVMYNYDVKTGVQDDGMPPIWCCYAVYTHAQSIGRVTGYFRITVRNR